VTAWSGGGPVEAPQTRERGAKGAGPASSARPARHVKHGGPLKLWFRLALAPVARHLRLQAAPRPPSVIQGRSDMKFFVDTADVNEIRELAATGVLDGVTTNPSLILKANRPMKEIIKEICEIVDGPVSAEVSEIEFDGMMRQADILRKIADNVTIKVPLTWDGLKACKALTEDGAMVNVTLCFSAPQALLAAKAGATFISPFVGRIDDMGVDGMELIQEIRTIYDNYPDFSTEILAASLRTTNHVKQAALAGADVATIPPAIIKGLVKHPLTDKGLETFVADWAKTGQTID
jgi:transaldolase